MKTTTLLTVFTIVVSVMISGCTLTDPDPDLDKFVNALGAIASAGAGSGSGHTSGQPSFYGPSVYGPTVWMDSVAHLSDSTATLWGHYQFNSVLVIQEGQLNYWEDINPIPTDLAVMRKPYLTQPDTIDFQTLPDSISGIKKEWIYRFSIKMDSLKSNTSYHFCISDDYQDTNQMKQFATCNYFMTK